MPGRRETGHLGEDGERVVPGLGRFAGLERRSCSDQPGRGVGRVLANEAPAQRAGLCHVAAEEQHRDEPDLSMAPDRVVLGGGTQILDRPIEVARPRPDESAHGPRPRRIRVLFENRRRAALGSLGATEPQLAVRQHARSLHVGRGDLEQAHELGPGRAEVPRARQQVPQVATGRHEPGIDGEGALVGLPSLSAAVATFDDDAQVPPGLREVLVEPDGAPQVGLSLGEESALEGDEPEVGARLAEARVILEGEPEARFGPIELPHGQMLGAGSVVLDGLCGEPAPAAPRWGQEERCGEDDCLQRSHDDSLIVGNRRRLRVGLPGMVSATVMELVRCSLLVVPLCWCLAFAGACAQGGDVPTGRGDGGPVGGGCTDGHGASCDSPVDLGTVEPGATVVSPVAGLRGSGAALWYLLRFPAMSAEMEMDGAGEIRIALTRNDGDVYAFDVMMSCTEVGACGGGDVTEAQGLSMYSFRDDPEETVTTRDVPWPEEVRVRVFRTGSSGCPSYQLQISR